MSSLVNVRSDVDHIFKETLLSELRSFVFGHCPAVVAESCRLVWFELALVRRSCECLVSHRLHLLGHQRYDVFRVTNFVKKVGADYFVVFELHSFD